VYVPRVIRERLFGRGAFLTLPFAAFALIAGAIAFGWPGLLALAFVGLVSLSGALWHELSWAEKGITTAEQARDQAVERQEELSERIEDATSEFQALRKSAVELESENNRLRQEARAPEVSIRKLVFACETQLGAIEQAQKHRSLIQRLGRSKWPAVSVTREGETVTVVAFVDHDASLLDGQTLRLVSKELGGDIGETKTVNAEGDRQVVARFPVQSLSRFVRRHFSSHAIQPEPFNLHLSSALGAVFEGFPDEDLEQVKDALRNVQTTISAIVMSREEGRKTA
jgi:hypothetical protein